MVKETTMILFFYVFFREELDWVVAMDFIEEFFFFSNDFFVSFSSRV